MHLLRSYVAGSPQFREHRTAEAPTLTRKMKTTAAGLARLAAITSQG